MLIYNPYFFDDTDVPFLKALRAYLVEPTKQSFNELCSFNVQHSQDLLLIPILKRTVTAYKDYIVIRLRYHREYERYSGKQLIIAKTAPGHTATPYCAFIAESKLYPVLHNSLIETIKDYAYFYIQGNVFIDISPRKQLINGYTRIKRKSIIIGRHMIYIKGSELYMDEDSEYFLSKGDLEITAVHPEHGSITYTLQCNTYIQFDFHVRRDTHVDEELAKKLYQSLP